MINEEYIYQQLNRYGSADFSQFEERFNEFKEDFKDKLTELKEELKDHSFSSACEIIDEIMDDCSTMGALDLRSQLEALQDHIQIEGCASVKELSMEFRDIVASFNDTIQMIDELIVGAKRTMAAA